MRSGVFENDDAAWQHLVATYSPVIYAWIRRAGLPPADAANLMQEVIRDIPQRIDGFFHDPDGETFRGWLRRITQSAVADFRRRQRDAMVPMVGGLTASPPPPQQAALPEESLLHPPRDVVIKDNREALTKVQSGFSSRNWEIFWRIAVEDQDTAEVAKEFGIWCQRT
jgi:RNA polymerase sigma factor (sigma-70 family)